MRIVLTGATGFLGRHLLAELSAMGHECRVLTNHDKNKYKHKLADFPGVEYLKVNLRVAAELETALQGADGVINLIGILNERGWGGAGFRAAHVAPVRALIAACELLGIRRFIQISALNAGLGSSHYLLSKGEAEDLLRSAGEIDETILRPAVIFGAGDSFFNRFAGLLRFVPLLPLACPNARMQPVWVGDVVAATALCLDHRATIGKTLDLVGPEVFTLFQLVNKTARYKGWQRRVIALPNWLSRCQAALMDFVPGKPFSSDNYRSLQIDSVSRHNGLLDLGIKPRGMDAIVPLYLAPKTSQTKTPEENPKEKDSDQPT
ncbi:MAG: complex I NDUFA9 subunit family protein [Xanthomonadales bacterium]|nr:complex I NDUFA9 subunit family protein [Xanthomonadales bacterium]